MGIHLGPCVSGLVGHILPFYTLVGEGTEIAKLMESTGEPMKIEVFIYIISMILLYFGRIILFICTFTRGN